MENTFIPIKNSWRQQYIVHENFLNASDACFKEFHTLLENVPDAKTVSNVDLPKEPRSVYGLLAH